MYSFTVRAIYSSAMLCHDRATVEYTGVTCTLHTGCQWDSLIAGIGQTPQLLCHYFRNDSISGKEDYDVMLFLNSIYKCTFM